MIGILAIVVRPIYAAVFSFMYKEILVYAMLQVSNNSFRENGFARASAPCRCVHDETIGNANSRELIARICSDTAENKISLKCLRTLVKTANQKF